MDVRQSTRQVNPVRYAILSNRCHNSLCSTVKKQDPRRSITIYLDTTHLVISSYSSRQSSIIASTQSSAFSNCQPSALRSLRREPLETVSLLSPYCRSNTSLPSPLPSLPSIRTRGLVPRTGVAAIKCTPVGKMAYNITIWVIGEQYHYLG